jgi:hypothetical protein
MATYAGFDISIYPGNAILQWLKANTNLAWSGFYLAPAPNHPDTTWMPAFDQTSVRTSLVGMGWGLAPVYVGQQVGSAQLTADQGTADAQDAVALAQSAGFPAATVIYLDIEQGGALPDEMIDYFKTWVQGVFNGGFNPGVYCSYLSANQLNQADARAQVWVWHLGAYSCQNDANNPYPAPDPATSGSVIALLWQYLQNCPIGAGGGASITVDLDSSSLQDPSAYVQPP